MNYAVRALSMVMTVVALGFSLPAQSTLSSPNVYNHANVFLSYWNDHKIDSPQDQIAQFKAKVVTSFPEFYDYKFESWRRSGKNPDEMLAIYLKDFPQIETAFKNKSVKVEIELLNALGSFKSFFHDLNTEFDVHIVHSLGEMDGGIRTLNGKPTFIFGVDNILKYHHGDSETAFFHHELYHKYHFQYFKGEEKIWAALWGEGLATYVSEALNPTASLAELGLDTPKGLVVECIAKKQILFQYILQNLDSGSEDVYQNLFLLGGRNDKIPLRAGYYFGYLIAKEMAKTRTLFELSRLDGPQLRQEIEATLKRLKNQGQ